MRADFTMETNLRRFVLLILVLGIAGTAAELLLAAHTEDPWQWAPLVLLGLAGAVIGWHTATGGHRDASPIGAGAAASVRALQALMVLFLFSGGAGIGLHIKGKMEFKRETDPGLDGWALFRGSLESKTPPALAPGVMIHLGLLGLAYAWRHPALRAGSREK
jgi:hypothetical protein